MLHFAETFDKPLTIRYPRGAAVTAMGQYDAPIRFGKAEILETGHGIALLAFGSMVQTAMEVHEALKEKQVSSTVVNLRFASPIDRKLIAQLTEEHNIIVTLEENVLRGGVGEFISAYLLEIGYTGSILPIGIPDAFVEQGSVNQLKEMLEIDASGIEHQILELYSR